MSLRSAIVKYNACAPLHRAGARWPHGSCLHFACIRDFSLARDTVRMGSTANLLTLPSCHPSDCDDILVVEEEVFLCAGTCQGSYH